MRNISFDLRIVFFGGANRIEYEEIPGQGVEDSESFKGISFKRLNHLIKMHLKQVADLNLRLVEVSKPKTIFKKSGIAYTFEEPNNSLSGVLIYIWTEDLDAQNLERLLSLGLEINKARRVAMRKLASSKIFLFQHNRISKRNSPNRRDRKTILESNRSTDLVDSKELNRLMRDFFRVIYLYTEDESFEEKATDQYETWVSLEGDRWSRVTVQGKIHMENKDIYSYKYDLFAKGLELADFKQILKLGLKHKKYSDFVK